MALRSSARSRRDPFSDEAIASLVEGPPPPSSALINAILEYADVEQRLGGARVTLRLSRRRQKDPVIRRLLGREARRLAEVSVLWDEDAGQIVQVLDEARAANDFDLDEAYASERDAFELTEAALAYIEAFERSRRR